MYQYSSISMGFLSHRAPALIAGEQLADPGPKAPMCLKNINEEFHQRGSDFI